MCSNVQALLIYVIVRNAHPLSVHVFRPLDRYSVQPFRICSRLAGLEFSCLPPDLVATRLYQIARDVPSWPNGYNSLKLLF